MNKLFKWIIAVFVTSMSAAAFAQCIPMNAPGPPRIWDGQRGCYVPQGTPALGSTPQVVLRPATVGHPVQMVAVPSHPGLFTHGTTTYRCSAFAKTVGEIAGAAIGHIIGKNITLEGHQLGTGGALYGAWRGQQIACEVIDGPAHAGIPAGHGVAHGHQPRTINVPSDCDIHDEPALQNLKGLTREQCAAIASRVGRHMTTSTSAVVAANGNTSAVISETPKAPALTFTNESAGPGLCRALSNGAVRLKNGNATVRGEVLATEAEYPKQSGEDCNQWRRRVAPMVVL